MKEVILKNSLILSIITNISFISIGIMFVFVHWNGTGYYESRSAALGVVMIVAMLIKFLFDVGFHKMQYVKVDSKGIYDNSSIFMSTNYKWYNINKLEVSDSGMIIHDNQSSHEIGGVYVNKDNLKLIQEYREKYITKTTENQHNQSFETLG